MRICIMLMCVMAITAQAEWGTAQYTGIMWEDKDDGNVVKLAALIAASMHSTPSHWEVTADMKKYAAKLKAGARRIRFAKQPLRKGYFLMFNTSMLLPTRLNIRYTKIERAIQKMKDEKPDATLTPQKWDAAYASLDSAAKTWALATGMTTLRIMGANSDAAMFKAWGVEYVPASDLAPTPREIGR